MKKLLFVAYGMFGLLGTAAAQPAFDPFGAFGRADAWQNVGRVYYLAGNFCPANALPTDGRLVSSQQFPTLSRLLGGSNAGRDAIALPKHAAPGGLTSCIVVTETGQPLEDTPLVSQMVNGVCTEPMLVPASGGRMIATHEQRLFSLIGFTYGGDGRNGFAVPNLAGWCIARDGVYPQR